MADTSDRYPIGKFQAVDEFDLQTVLSHIHTIERLPFKLRQVVESLDTSSLNRQYREGSWNVRQLVHHIADSHMNGYIRTKWALTEKNPTIKDYDENGWMKLGDSNELPIEVSLRLIESLHERWAYLFRNLEDAQWKRTFIHPEKGDTRTLYQHAGMYAWHGEHHLAHVKKAVGG